jgi:hypothetical protein
MRIVVENRGDPGFGQNGDLRIRKILANRPNRRRRKNSIPNPVGGTDYNPFHIANVNLLSSVRLKANA